MTDPRLLDKEWRMAHLYKIRNKNQELVQFKRNKAQQHYALHKHTRNLILKSRQLGFTTDEAVDSLDDTLFTRNMECLLIAHGLKPAEDIFDKKIELAWKSMHQDLRSLWKVDTNTAQALKFEFGDGTFSSISVSTSGRSGTYNRVHVTEFANICRKYPEKAREIIEGTIPAVPTHGRVDIESTSEGASGRFYEMCMEAYQRGEPTNPLEFKFHFYNWTWDEEIDNMKAVAVPAEFKIYQATHSLTDVQITYYYYKWISLNKDWNALHREFPTTPEEAFEAIVEGTFYGVEVGLMERSGRVTAVAHDQALNVHTSWDLGIGKNLVVGFYQKDPMTNLLKKIDYLEGEEGDGLPQMIAKVKAKPYIYGKHFAPHDIKATDQSTGKTRFETAKALGIAFTIVPDIGVSDGINASKLVLSRLWVDKENCKEWVKAMKNYVREWDDKRGMYKDVPYHNWASHGADEWRYAALSEKYMTNDVAEKQKEMFNPNMDDIYKSLPSASDWKP